MGQGVNCVGSLMTSMEKVGVRSRDLVGCGFGRWGKRWPLKGWGTIFGFLF